MIHFIWIGNKEKNKFSETPRAWESIGYSVTEWDEDQIIELMKSERMLKQLRIFLSLQSYIRKADFARIVVLIAKGGIYMDYDIYPNGNGLHTFSKQDTALVLEHGELNGAPIIANGILYSRSPYNPFFVKFLNDNYKETYKSVLEYLGPHALTNHLLGWRKAQKILILPAKIMLWEDQCGMTPSFVVSRHLNACSWGGNRSESNWQDGY